MRQFISTLLLLIAGTMTSAAWDNSADARLPQHQRRVVMMGNSITDYWKNHEVNNHKEFFDDNGALCRGVAGQKTPAMKERFMKDVVSLNPLVVVIAGGVNDINAGTAPDEVYRNTLKMVEMAEAAGIRPILASINPSGWGKSTVDKYRQYNALVKAYCEQHGYGYANYFDALKMSDADYNEMKPEYRGRADHSDHLHPSRAGYIVMEGVLIPLIEDALWHDGTYPAEHAARIDGAYRFGYTAAQAGAFALTVTRSDAMTQTELSVSVNGTTLRAEAKAGEASVTLHILLRRGYNTFSVSAGDGGGDTMEHFAIVAAPGMEARALSDYFPTYSIMGDSYSTYKGWIDAGVDFGGGGYEYPQPKYDLTSVDDTWWKQFEQRSGCRLEQNNSISGTCMSYISLNGSGTTKTVSFANRVTKMRGADLFIIEGGTNDFSGGRTVYTKAADESINGQKIVGEYMWDGFEADMPQYRFVRPTVAYLIWYLQHKYPGCTVVFMANNSIPEEGKESFRNICQHYGVPYYEMHDIAKVNGHPVKAGMASIADQLTEALVNYILEGNTPVAELPQYYIYNVGQRKYVKTGGIDKTPDSPTLVDTKEEATAQYITPRSDGTYLICDPDWRKGWGVQGRQTVYISTNGVERTASWGSNLTPGWTFRAADATAADRQRVYIAYSWGDYEPGTYPVEDPAGTSFALYYGAYGQPTDQWNRTARNEVKADGIYGGRLDAMAQYGDNALWQLIPVNGLLPDIIPADPSTITPVVRNTAADGIAYDLAGRRATKDARGIVITNGKKILRQP